MLPSIEPSEVGATGLLWLFLSYGYLLYRASNLIAEGSDLLLLVPSLAGIVGSIILPILGAVPDGAIMLFSGLGDMETAQETLSIGVGALAGSTIMLLTVPFSLSVFAGRVDYHPTKGSPNYHGKPKLRTDGGVSHALLNTGVSITTEIKHGAVIMTLTTVPYFLIQVPALFLHGPREEVARGERAWALSGLIVCLVGFVSYLVLQVRIAHRGEDRMRRVAVMKKLIKQGAVSLSGAMADTVKTEERRQHHRMAKSSSYRSIENGPGDDFPSDPIKEYLRDVLVDAFQKYDKDKNASLDRKEVKLFCCDFHEDISDREVDELFDKYDSDNDGTISFDEFCYACYNIIKCQTSHESDSGQYTDFVRSFCARDGEEEEEEEIPDDISSLPVERQQAAIVRKALIMLATGTVVVLIFSDPMVDVLQELAGRLGMSPFYVSFILAPLAANASEVIASQYYAAKKTRKTIAVSLTALEGAASMNNTFCLSIFMGLIYCRGLAWQYTAETVAIVLVQLIMGVFVQKKSMTAMEGLIVLSIFPLSIVLVFVLELLGFD